MEAGALRDDDTIAFAEKVIALLGQAALTSTYKYAVMLGLIDLCLEGVSAAGAPPNMVTTAQLAEVVTRLYWPQVLPFRDAAERVLRQNNQGQAEIVSLIAKAREDLAGGGGSPLERVRRESPREYQALLRAVEWKLVEMPLPRLQIFGRQEERFIYEIAWSTSTPVTLRQFKANAFNNAIQFLPGVSSHLVRLDGLLRPLLYRGWTAHVARINRLTESNLERHLFGVDRSVLRPVMRGLAELQEGRCFYCDGRLESPEVDHFLPWARVQLDAIENLVVADEACNGNKRELLAAGEHLARWRERIDASQALLTGIADRARWESNPSRTLGVARALYLPLQPRARLWSSRTTLVLADPQQLRAVLAR